jgi:quaternary ammonium compound-resistance protein SugE
MDWTYLIIAGLLEIIWALSLKLSDGFTKFWPTATTILTTILSIYFLGKF